MRATLLSSTATGLGFGAFAEFFGHNGSVETIMLTVVFFASTFVGVIGIGQHREMKAERKCRGIPFLGPMFEPEDFERFYFPAWWRMATWFVGVVAGVLLCK